MKIDILGSGSKGNCTLISTPKAKILLDIGFNAKQTTLKLEKAGVEPHEITAILITHEHSDHIKGARVFADRHNIPVYCNRNTAEAMRYGNKAPAKFTLFENGQEITIGDCQVFPFSIPHDSADATAYTIKHYGLKAAFATDLGLAGQATTQFIKDSDFILIESNHDVEKLLQSDRPFQLKKRISSRIGHLSNEQAMDLLRTCLTSRTRHLVLAHLSTDCNSPALVEEMTHKVVSDMGLNGLNIQIAKQDEPLASIEL